VASRRKEFLNGKVWTVYVLRCADGTLYAGVTTDLTRRLRQHAAGVAAHYTRGRGPFTVVYKEHGYTRAQALRREWELKQWPKEKKEALVAQTPAGG
jgi:putative endonuclease